MIEARSQSQLQQANKRIIDLESCVAQILDIVALDRHSLGEAPAHVELLPHGLGHLRLRNLQASLLLHRVYH